MHARGIIALLSSRVFGMGECVCLSSMHASHLEGIEDVFIDMLLVAWERAILMTVCGLQCPRQ